MNIQIDKFVYHSDLETKILAFFPSKSFNHTAILIEIGDLNHRKIYHFYKNRCYVASKCGIIESNYDV